MFADTEIWRRVAVRIDELSTIQLERMAAGACKDHGEYMRAVGYLQGLKDVIGAAQDVFGGMTGSSDLEGDEDDEGN